MKVMKKSQNSRNQGFSYLFCFTEGSGSERPKNTWILVGESATPRLKRSRSDKQRAVEARTGTIEAGRVDRRAISGRRLAEWQQEEGQLRPEEKQK
jgi:hypothetical protein